MNNMPKPLFRILLGTNNQGKLQEMSALLEGAPIELLVPLDLNLEIKVEESGGSYQENAVLKARYWSAQSGLASLADDSGLEVDALDGAPGLFSHRFTGNPNASDSERRNYLLERLSNHPHPWSARFICAVAIAIPAQELITCVGSCEGEIISTERGTNGFGYDPIFMVSGTGKTMAELSMEQKNHLSHRAQAMQAARTILVEKLNKS